jgi:hypothetical protein
MPLIKVYNIDSDLYGLKGHSILKSVRPFIFGYVVIPKLHEWCLRRHVRAASAEALFLQDLQRRSMVPTVPLALVSLPFPVRQHAASIAENLGTLLRIAPTRSRIAQTINKVLGILLKLREMWARTLRRRDESITPKWLQHRKANR